MTMSKHTKFPKAWALGHRNTQGIWEGTVEITEKVDGSQIGFGVIDGELVVRSKNCEVHRGAAGMFHEAVEYLYTIQSLLLPNLFYYGEYLKNPKHNTLTYNRIPNNHIALFGIKKPDGTFIKDYDDLAGVAELLGLEAVPVLWHGEVADVDKAIQLLDTESFLGGPKVEGFVVKNYNKDIVIGGEWIPFIQAKYVSEAFKEKHIKGWKSGPNKLEELFLSLENDTARWQKAVNNLRDEGKLEDSPRDIGMLLKYITEDFLEEEKDAFVDALYNIYEKQLKKSVARGFPEWYKETLMKKSFECPTVDKGEDNG